MTNGVGYETRLHTIGGQEDGVAVDESLGNGGLGDISYYGLITDGWVGFSCDPLRYGDLM